MEGGDAPDHWRADDDLAARVNAALADCRQGDVIANCTTLSLALAASPLSPEAAELAGEGVKALHVNFEHVAVVTQSCDVIRDCRHRPYVQVAPIVRLTGQTLALAGKRKLPRYAAVPGAGADAFADLDRCTTLEKTVLAGLDRVRGCTTDVEIDYFAAGVAKHRDRFAFPDDWHEATKKLAKRVEARAGRDSPEGRCVDAVTQIRAVATPAWDASDGYSAQLEFIVEAEALGALDDNDNSVEPVIVDFLQTNPTDAELCKQIDDLAAEATTATRSVLWTALAQRWAALVEPTGRVKEVSGSAESELTYPVFRLDRSAQLEFDYLSAAGEPDDEAN